MTAPLTDHTHLSPAVQSRAFDLYYNEDGTRRGGIDWNGVAAILGLPPTTDRGYSVARWAAYQERTRRGLIVRRPVERIRFTGRRFGVEIEYSNYTVDRGHLAQLIRDAGQPAEWEDYNHRQRAHWKCTTDATVSGGEVVSPILRGKPGYEAVKAVCRAIKAAGGSVDRQCGLHVHHDVTDFDNDGITRLVRNIKNAQTALAGYVSSSRSRNRWCPTMTAAEFDQIEARFRAGEVALRGGSGCPVDSWCNGGRCNHRYRAWNFTSILSYGTVEFRIMSGSLNAPKIRTWIEVGSALVEFTKQGGEITESVSARQLVDLLVDARLLTRATADKFINRVRALHGARAAA